jgi:DNA-binding MarR family transcriptional regulator
VSTAARFDEIVHAPNRLQICAVLSAVSSADFAAVREGLGVADSVLSKHIRVLHEAGYIDVHKSTCASRVRTSMSMTAAGRAAYDGHLAALRAIVSNEGFRIDARRGDDLAEPPGPEGTRSVREDARQRAAESVKELYPSGAIDADRLDTSVDEVLAARSETEPAG